MSTSKKKKGLWSEDNMKNAMELLLRNEISEREAVKRFAIPRSTLKSRLKAIKAEEEVNFTPKLGFFCPTFDKELENQLVMYIKDLDSKLMPLNKKEFLKFVYDLAEHLKLPHRFNKFKKTASTKFYYSFLKRHPDLSFRSPESTRSQKELGLNKDQVEYFFNKYLDLLDKYKFTPNRIYNCGERGISIVPGSKYIKMISILLTINGTGDLYVPPLFGYPHEEQIDDVLKNNAPAGSIFVAEENGSITTKSFKTWMDLFVKKTHPTKEEPVLLILDAHSSHKDLDVLLFAKEHHVHILSFPPHTTHKMQPLDHGIIEQFKTTYASASSTWMQTNSPLEVTLNDIVGFTATAYNSICKMELVKNAFKCTGLWPVDRNVFKDTDFVDLNLIKESENYLINKPQVQAATSSVQVVENEVNGNFQAYRVVDVTSNGQLHYQPFEQSNCTTESVESTPDIEYFNF